MAHDGATASVKVPKSCLAQHRRKIKRAEALDLISSLPDDILQHILSFIPTPLAIRTSILSKRWRHVWSGTPYLSFHDSYSLKGDSIYKTLACYTASKIKTFHLGTSKFDHLPYIDRWIEFAMSRNVENMSMNVDSLRGKRLEIPDIFYISSSVKQLSLRLSFHDMTPRCSVSWTSLKKLYLRSCKLSDESISNILSGCPILESLTLSSCYELRVLDLSKSSRLRILVIDRRSWAAGPTQIVAPHIHSLILREPWVPCTLDDVSSLREAKVDFYFSSVEDQYADFLQANVLKMLEKLQNVEKLTFGENFLKTLSFAKLQYVHLPNFKVKTLILETTISPYVIPAIVKVLQIFPELKKLIIHITNYDSNSRIDVKYLGSHGLNSAQIWSSDGKVFQDISCWNVESKHVALFMELIVKTANTLEKMVVRLEVDFKGKGFEELLQMVSVLTHNNNVSIELSSTKPKQSDWGLYRHYTSILV